jgi:putative membrane protein
MTALRNILPKDPWNRAVTIAFLVLWAISCINLPYPEYFVMQHMPTVVGIVGLIAIERKLRTDRLSYSLVIAFLLLHLVGARYLYSNVPYDDWSQALIGFRIGERLGFERNHYDRLVHLCFGLLFAYLLWQLFAQQARMTGWWPGVMAACVVLAASGAYEIAEWATAMTFAPDWAEAYNGQQGDVWDPQRDMTLATVGSLAGVVLIGCRRQLSSRKTPR